MAAAEDGDKRSMGKDMRLVSSWRDAAFLAFLILVSLLATIKIIFFGIEIDEQYAVAMGYRMARGDRMFIEMWEPHQMSGFLAAIFIKIYLSVTGHVSGVMVYLRVMGVCIQLITAILAYHVCKTICTKRMALIIAFFIYNTMPKYSEVPEFANMLFWFSVIMFLCLVEYYKDGSLGRFGWLIGAAVSTSLLVLSYPTCVLVVIPNSIGIWKVASGRKRIRDMGGYLGICAICGGLYLAFFLSHMSFDEFWYGISQMLADGSHDTTILQKIIDFKETLVGIFPHIAICVCVALAGWGCLRLCRGKQYDFWVVLLVVSILEQLYVWIFEDHYFKYPNIFFVVIWMLGIVRYMRLRKSGVAGQNRDHRILFWFGSMAAGWILLAAMIASVTRITDFVEYMAIGMIAALVYLEQEEKETPIWWLLVVLALLGVVSFRKGYLMYSMWANDTVFVTKQKVVSGPLKGIYCRWSDGTAFNETAEILKAHVPEQSKVLYVGSDMIVYLLGEYEACNFSTISTPTMDQKLLDYWEKHPYKYPEYVIWDTRTLEKFTPAPEVRAKISENSESVTEEKHILIYKMNWSSLQ